jgi:hypothetical protein
MTIMTRESDWGSSEPFVARLFVGIIDIRGYLGVLKNDPRNNELGIENFDKYYEPIRRNLEIILRTAISLNDVLTSYQNDLFEDNGIVKISNGNIEITKSINTELDRDIGEIINLSVITCKTNLQRFLREVFNFDIGFLFQKPQTFQKKINEFKNNGEYAFYSYCTEIRNLWLEELIDLRTKREHDSWHLEKIKFSGEPPALHVYFPTINNIPVNLYSRQTVNRSCFFVENMISYAFQRIVNSPIKLIELDNNLRNAACPTRFQFAPKFDYLDYWSIGFSDSFDFL